MYKFALFLGSLLLFVSWTSLGAQQYRVLELGDLGGGRTHVRDLNNAGQVVGYSVNAAGNLRAFLWTKQSGMQDLGTLGGADSQAYAVNEAGVVVGVSATAAGEYHAFLWEAGQMRDLGTVSGNWSAARDVNDQREVIGLCRDAKGNDHLFLWSETEGMRTLDGVFWHESEGRAINDAGVAAGSVLGKGVGYENMRIPMVWENQQARYIETAKFTFGKATAINLAGQVVGNMARKPEPHQERAFLWDAKGGTIVMGTFGGARSYAEDINLAGDVVGSAIDTKDQFRGFVWQDGEMLDLNGLLTNPTFCKISDAIAINDRGAIVAEGWRENRMMAVLLEPTGRIVANALPAAGNRRG